MTIRLDQIILGITDKVCASIDSRLGPGTAEQAGVKRIVEAVIIEHGIPTDPIDLPMTIARNVLGLLPEAKRRRPPSSQLASGDGGRKRRAHHGL